MGLAPAAPVPAPPAAPQGDVAAIGQLLSDSINIDNND